MEYDGMCNKFNLFLEGARYPASGEMSGFVAGDCLENASPAHSEATECYNSVRHSER